MATKKTTKTTNKKETSKTTKTKASAKKKVTEDDIRKRAEEIYKERIKNNIPGDELSDWLQAKKELGIEEKK